MFPNLPVCCSPKAFDLLKGQMRHVTSSDALLNGAVAIAMHQVPDADPAQVDATIQQYADTIRSRVRGRQPQALLAHLHEHLFDELGFAGNGEDYYNPANSYLPTVLGTKRGLPITLSLVYKLVAERVGLRSWGVALPGHFVSGVDVHGSVMLVDAFNGGKVLSVDEAHERMKQSFGPEVEWSEEMLQPASNRHWLTRLLQNLLNTFGSNNHYVDVAAVLEMEMAIWPEQAHLQRDLGLVLARCGMVRPASIWLDCYLQTNPDDPQKGQLQELLQVLGT
jgi:regulator of sirC expression with transglutaminase-like and TPR domain